MIVRPEPLRYGAEKWELYCQGALFDQWYQEYRKLYLNGYLLFSKDERDDRKQVPRLVNGVKQGSNDFFPDFIVGIHYLRKGYNVVRDYRNVALDRYPERRERHHKAREVLGGEDVASFVCEKKFDRKRDIHPPDLLVFDSRNRFFFSEVKLLNDELSIDQLKFFIEIERRLNRLAPPTLQALVLPRGHWVEVVYLQPRT